MRRMQGQWALVTGASSGIGWDIADLLGEQGCNLVLTARREARLLELQEQIAGKYGVKVEVIASDLSGPEAPVSLYDEIQARGIRIDVLVNNAGYGVHGSFAHIPWEKTGVKCSVLCPGVTATEFHEVAGQDDKSFFVRALSMTSRNVARLGIAALFKGKPYVVTGAMNAFNAQVMQRLPRTLATGIAYLTMGPPRELGG